MSDLQDVETAVKVLVVGNGGVGKTSLIKRFCKGQYTDEYKKTIGVDFLERQVTMPSMDEPVTLMLWDTAGQEEFGAITRSYYRGNDGDDLYYVQARVLLSCVSRRRIELHSMR